MGLFDLNFQKRDRPSHSYSLSDVSAPGFVMGRLPTFSGEAVDETAALSIPAVSAAVQAISQTIAQLPLNLFRRTSEGRVKAEATDPLQRIVHDVINPDTYMTSYQWRAWAVTRLLLTNRCYTYISYNGAGRVLGLYPLDSTRMKVEVTATSKTYVYDDGLKVHRYKPSEIIDLVRGPLAPDGITHRDPIVMNRNIIGEMIAAQRAASQMFESGGVPSHIIKQPQGSPEAMERGAESIFEALKNMRAKKRPAMALPNGFDIVPIGIDPQKQQHVQLRNFHLTEVARIFGLPPSFLQDHSRSTFSNVEQLNLHYSQHTILPLCAMIEAELNAKLFSDRNRSSYVEFNLEGLERGDKKSQYEGFRIGVQGGFLTPNEVRGWLNLPADPDGDKLFMQGATVPIADAGIQPAEPIQPAPEVEAPEDEGDDQ